MSRLFARTVPGVLSLLAVAAAPVVAQPFTGLTTTNQIFQFDAASPGTTTGLANVVGLNAGDNLVGIDYNPNNGVLVGVGYNTATGTGRVYSISASGAATLFNPNAIEFGSGVTSFAVDINPVANALRVFTNRVGNSSTTAGRTVADGSENNFRIAMAAAGTVFYDGDVSQQAGIVSTAYTNNVPTGTNGTTTVLYVIDSSSGAGNTPSLRTVPTPNSGVLTAGVQTIQTFTGFDILNTTAFGNDTAYASTGTNLFRLNLADGSATTVGTFGGLGGAQVLDISGFQPVPEPATVGLLATAALCLGRLVRRRFV